MRRCHFRVTCKIPSILNWSLSRNISLINMYLMVSVLLMHVDFRFAHVACIAANPWMFTLRSPLCFRTYGRSIQHLGDERCTDVQPGSDGSSDGPYVRHVWALGKNVYSEGAWNGMGLDSEFADIQLTKCYSLLCDYIRQAQVLNTDHIRLMYEKLILMSFKS